MRPRTWIKLAGLWLWIGLCLFLLSLILTSYRPVGGIRPQVVLSGSMRPAILPGSLIFTKELRPEQYQVGDVITFSRPSRPGELITHRIQAVTVNRRGVTVMQTKGDANLSSDDEQVGRGAIIGKLWGQIPFLGFLLNALKTPIGFLIFAFLFFICFVVPEVYYIRSLFSNMAV